MRTFLSGLAFAAIAFLLVLYWAEANDWVRANEWVHVLAPVIGYLIGAPIYQRVAERYNWGPWAGFKIWLAVVGVGMVVITVLGAFGY